MSGSSDEIGHSGLIYAPNCVGCPFEGQKIVPPNGNLEATVAIVGEGPGEHEERQGRGFVGRSGKLLDELLRRNGVDRSEVFITNCTLCRPKAVTMQIPQADGSTKDVYLNHDQAKLNAMIRCRPRLLSELAAVRPRVIIPLGGLAFEAISGEWDGIVKRRGAIHQPDMAAEYAKSMAALDAPLLKQKPKPRKKAAKKPKKPKTYIRRKIKMYLETPAKELMAVLECGHQYHMKSRRKKLFNCTLCVQTPDIDD